MIGHEDQLPKEMLYVPAIPALAVSKKIIWGGAKGMVCPIRPQINMYSRVRPVKAVLFPMQKKGELRSDSPAAQVKAECGFWGFWAYLKE